MKKEGSKSWIILIIVILVAGLIYVCLTVPSSNQENLCLFKIPNQITFNCNGTSLEGYSVSLFGIKNAEIKSNCSIINMSYSDSFHYEINDCKETTLFNPKKINI